MEIVALPAEAETLCKIFGAPPKLIAHLILVHDVACQLCEALAEMVPSLEFDEKTVCMGAAIHDLGKVIYPNEITGQGDKHQEVGPELLYDFDIAPHVAQIAATHGQWRNTDLPIEDLLVALADNIWCGKREPDLESRIADLLPGDQWKNFLILDQIVTPIADQGEERLAWQREHIA